MEFDVSSDSDLLDLRKDYNQRGDTTDSFVTDDDLKSLTYKESSQVKASTNQAFDNDDQNDDLCESNYEAGSVSHKSQTQKSSVRADTQSKRSQSQGSDQQDEGMESERSEEEYDNEDDQDNDSVEEG